METKIIKEVKYGRCGNEDLKVLRWSSKMKGVVQIIPENYDYDEPAMCIQKEDIPGLIDALVHAYNEKWIPEED